MNAQALMTRMTPLTLASFIADLDNAPGDYDQETIDLMQDALETLFGLVGRADAMALLSEYDVSASNPLVEAMVEASVEPDTTAYVIRSSTGAFFDGIHAGESIVWIDNLQSVDPYVKLEFAERHLPDAQSDHLWRGDSDARIYTVTRDDKGYLHLGGAA